MGVISAKYVNKSASSQILDIPGRVFGVIVNSHTNGTMKLWDSATATGTVIVNTYTFATGSQTILFPAPIEFNTALYFTLGGTADVTFIVAPH